MYFKSPKKKIPNYYPKLLYPVHGIDKVLEGRTLSKLQPRTAGIVVRLSGRIDYLSDL